MFAILPIIGVMVSSASRKFRKQSRKIQAAMGDLTHIASETTTISRGAHGGEDYESARFLRRKRGEYAQTTQRRSARSHLHPALQLVIFTDDDRPVPGLASAWRETTAGDLAAYITAAGMLPKPIRQLSEVSGTIQKACRRRKHLRAT